MKQLFLALMAVAAIALTGCNNPMNEPEIDPEAPENRRDPTECVPDTAWPDPHACVFRSRGTFSDSWYWYQESEMSVVGYVPSVPLHDAVSELTFTICQDASPTFYACAVTVRQAPGGAMS